MDENDRTAILKCMGRDYDRITDAAEKILESYVWSREPDFHKKHAFVDFDSDEYTFMEQQTARILSWTRHAIQELPRVASPETYPHEWTEITERLKLLKRDSECIMAVWAWHRGGNALSASDHDTIEKYAGDCIHRAYMARDEHNALYATPYDNTYDESTLISEWTELFMEE